jgi:hypothetical protein
VFLIRPLCFVPENLVQLDNTIIYFRQRMFLHRVLYKKYTFFPITKISSFSLESHMEESEAKYFNLALLVRFKLSSER